MYARVTISQSQPGKINEAIQIYRDSILPVARQQQGFKGALFLTDEGANKAISISLWEMEADLKAGETSGYYQAQIAKVASLNRCEKRMRWASRRFSKAAQAGTREC